VDPLDQIDDLLAVLAAEDPELVLEDDDVDSSRAAAARRGLSEPATSSHTTSGARASASGESTRHDPGGRRQRRRIASASDAVNVAIRTESADTFRCAIEANPGMQRSSSLCSSRWRAPDALDTRYTFTETRTRGDP
jgi:hypothetical protein